MGGSRTSEGQQPPLRRRDWRGRKGICAETARVPVLDYLSGTIWVKHAKAQHAKMRRPSKKIHLLLLGRADLRKISDLPLVTAGTRLGYPSGTQAGNQPRSKQKPRRRT